MEIKDFLEVAMSKKFLLTILASFCVSCSGQDSEFIPYRLKGMGAWVSDESGNSYYAGLAEGNYSDRDDLKAQCADLAYELAEFKHIKNYSYVCCTVTADSDCETKIR